MIFFPTCWYIFSLIFPHTASFPLEHLPFFRGFLSDPSGRWGDAKGDACVASDVTGRRVSAWLEPFEPWKTDLVGGAITILKNWVRQWEGWQPIYEMDNKSHVWNQPDTFVDGFMGISPWISLGKWRDYSKHYTIILYNPKEWDIYI